MVAPITKVTDDNGYLEISYDWISVCGYQLDDLVPTEARGNARHRTGPKGRFRITVEFWPEAKK